MDASQGISIIKMIQVTPQERTRPQMAPDISNITTQEPQQSSRFSTLHKLWSSNTVFSSRTPTDILPTYQQNIARKQIEDYRPGYPRFAAIIGAHAPFHISRRFARLRSRLVLLKQDQLSSLEANLEAVDANETKAIYLGNHRRDNNPARKQILQEIDCALKEYDELIERNHRMLNHESAQPLNVASLQNWVQSTGCLSRDETAYLGAEEDLICVAAQTDTFLVRLELLLERALLSCWSGFAGCFRSPISRDPNVYIFSGAFIKRFARAAAASGVVLLLLLPVIVINSLASTLLRLVLIVLSTAMVIILLAVLTKARTGDMFVAGATYATVLVVFVAGTGQSVC